MLRFLCVFTALFFTTSMEASVLAKDKIIPVEAFSKLPNISQPKLSPSGTKLGFFIDLKGKSALFVQNIDGENPKVIPAPANTSIEAFYWKTDNIMILTSGGTSKRDEFRTKVHETRVQSYDLKKNKLRWLAKPKKNKRMSQNERIVDLLLDDPDHVLLQMDFELDGASTVYKANVHSGKYRSVKPARQGIQNWFTDYSSEVRLGTGFSGETFNIRFKNAKGEWQDLSNTDWYQKYTFEGFTTDPNIIYVSGQTDHGTNGLFTLDLQSGEIVESLFIHEMVDMDFITLNPITNKPAGVTYTTDFQHTKYFDKTLSKIQRSIAKALKSKNVTLISSARDRELYMFVLSNDTDPGSYYVYDRENKKLGYFASARDFIDPKQMASVLSVNVPTRDDDAVPTYITVPNGIETPKNMPTIILPHGGPYGVRDDAHWNYWTQFYASRGYLVVQPNFRGSGGYGDHHYAKGVKQWGGLMQDDVTDATKWVIDQGYTDPEKVCIVGWSYGGYASLMGPIKEPGLYKCAISINGVANLPRLKVTDKKSTIGGSAWIKRMGHEDKNDRDVSPYHRATEFNIPVMLIATKDDARVPYEHSADMHKALKKQGTKSEYILFEEGGHSMYTSDNRKKMLEATEKFLKEHLGS
ncbi:S9 family peptidase [Kordiimonas sp. SCSIO 12603]|uniref:alpha/beta hydrolase family protein n=1 Tax=Kordiimonas sp. SCSIO 12603 TaxID=2829596 RepID=UPI0021055419|nr:alpha/beta fold hydrolase [Kordiimonas sp. SCSIO 12603]UTW59609.1 S9 family peptidase [Kordiimonas sp. SCSIO 12603]